MAFANGMIFAPVVNLSSDYNGYSFTFGEGFTTGTGVLVALDGATGEIVWQVDVPSMPLGGMTVANDVVFTGGLDGIVRGLNVEDGSEVFSYQAPAGINTSFAISGDYLFVPAGTFLASSVASSDSAPEPDPSLVALKLGGEVQGTPSAAGTPSAVGSPTS
jgi:outer membrane protein assembly factor BamB